MTFMDDPQNGTDVVVKCRTRKGQQRSLSLAKIQDSPENEDDQEGDARLLPSKNDLDFHVLKLDLKMGPHGSSTASTLVSQLEKSSIANLLDDRINASLKHLDKLRTRVEDTSSKVLVTGDLNAGKSTLVNALLRRGVMPVDQQPCTTAFCEVHDASENDGKEEIHILSVHNASTYSPKDENTFERGTVDDLEDLIDENEDGSKIIKVYINDSRPSVDSFLNNGIADISLIDAPGLNTDSVKTTALFSRQEEIDVVVFVVSAENHFTLSAKEFLQNASREKAYVFIVVNKFEGIRNKEKCRRAVLEQVKELSPLTYENAADLVHFVESSRVLDTQPTNTAFNTLESSLRSFVLQKRSKSKLHPAANYLANLLSDVNLLAGSNAILAKADLEKARDSLDRARPVLDKMKGGRTGLDDSLEHVEEQKTEKASRDTTEIINQALDKVGNGELGTENAVCKMPSFPGLLRLWDYVHDVRKALLTSIDEAVKLAEDEARLTTSDGVKDISALADRFLPEGVERSRRVFMPEAMFSRRRSAKNGKVRRGSSDAIVAGGLYGLGIGLAQRQDLLETSPLDVLDIAHHYHHYFGKEEDAAANSAEDDGMPSALSVLSLGLGALTMVGGKAIGVSSIVDGAVKISDLLGNETARKWIAPLLGAAALGLSAYLIIELPSSIPRTVGRRIRATLVVPDQSGSTFVSSHSLRVARETRKVLRLAAYEQRERFRVAMEASAKEVENAERIERQADKALKWFENVQTRIGHVKVDVSEVGDL